MTDKELVVEIRRLIRQFQKNPEPLVFNRINNLVKLLTYLDRDL